MENLTAESISNDILRALEHIRLPLDGLVAQTYDDINIMVGGIFDVKRDSSNIASLVLYLLLVMLTG